MSEESVLLSSAAQHTTLPTSLPTKAHWKTDLVLSWSAASALQEEFARERAQVDAVVASIEEEDRQEAAARRAQQAATRDYVQSFVEEQHRLKQRRQQELDAEDARQAQPSCSQCTHTALMLHWNSLAQLLRLRFCWLHTAAITVPQDSLFHTTRSECSMRFLTLHLIFT